MQVCPWCAAGVHRISTEPSPRNRMSWAFVSDSSRNGEVLTGESALETALTSVVIGLTAQFVTLIFLLTAQSNTHLTRNIVYSGFAGLLAGMVAFVLMRTYDTVQSSDARCGRCGLRLSQ